MRNYAELQYHADITEALHIVKQWRDKSDNKELVSLSRALIGVSGYVANLHNERRAFDRIVSELREDKWRAVKRAEKSEKL